MHTDIDNITQDQERLQAAFLEAMQSVAAANAALEAKTVEHEVLRSEHETMKALYGEASAEVDKLRNLVKQLQRTLFGRRSEKIDPHQFQLALEDTEQAIGTAEAAREAAAPREKRERSSRTKQPQRNRGDLPSHLPQIDVTVDIEDKTCPCCGGELHLMGEEVRKMLDIVPAQFRVKVIHNLKYACRGCEEAVVQAPAPERPITGGMATEALLAYIIISKFCDHLPLYRQAQIYARLGINLDRSTMADWVGRTAWWLRPLYDLLTTTVLASPKLFADDTPLPVLDPGRGKTKTGRLWGYARDDRPWNGPLPPAVVYIYAEDRKGKRTREHLEDFVGTLQVDAYAGFNALASPGRSAGPVTLAFCWSHGRRKFFEVFKTLGSPIAAEVLRRIAELYAIEDRIRGRSAEQRAAVRNVESRPLVEALKTYMEEQLGRLSGKTKLAEAIRYVLGHWQGFIVFLDDGRVEMDSNTIERTFRPIALGRKNHMFAGSDGGAESWALFASLIQTCKLNGVDPHAWLLDVLVRIVSGQTKINELHTLLPWEWKAANQAEVAAAN